ncbi:MAG: proteasome assembly chaperone family protein, partial [Candidatus Micrarchaeia archaeon]
MVKIIEFEKIEKIDYLLEGFPGIGLVATMVSSYLIDKLKMRVVASIESPQFPPLTSIHNGRPLPPARIYFDDNSKLAIFFSEFVIPPSLVYELSDLIINYSKEKNAKLIISVGGLTGGKEGASIAYGVASNEKMLKILEEAGALPIKEGATTGINGIVLSKSAQLGIDAISILLPVDPKFTNPRHAQIAIEILKKILPINVDTTQLAEEADILEKQIRETLNTHKRKINTYKKAIRDYGG